MNFDDEKDSRINEGKKSFLEFFLLSVQFNDRHNEKYEYESSVQPLLFILLL